MPSGKETGAVQASGRSRPIIIVSKDQFMLQTYISRPWAGMYKNDIHGVFCVMLISYLTAMKTIVIVVPEKSVIQTISGPQYCFSVVNSILAAKGKKPLFNIIVAGAKKSIHLQEGLFTVHPQLTLHEVKKADLIFIPALLGNMKEGIDANKNLVGWLHEQYLQGAELASLCVGAFLLGATGLLENKSCSTHWSYANEFRTMFPDTDVQEGTIITEEKRIYSSGGANSYWNLLLYLVEKYTDREMAITIAKYFAIDIDRNNQSAFAMFQGQKSHGDPEVKKVQDLIERKVEERVTVDVLADKVAVGRRSLERRFRSATGNSVHEYIQRVKIEAAKRRFESSRKNINEVMYEVGYSDTKAFRTVFKKITGLTPAEYRQKYNKMAKA